MKYTMDDLDLNKVREFLIDYYESAYFVGIPSAKKDLDLVKECSDEDLLEFVNKTTFNYQLFEKKKKITI